MREETGETREPTIDFTWLCAGWASIAFACWIYALANSAAGTFSNSTMTVLAAFFATTGYLLRRRAINGHFNAPEHPHTLESSVDNDTPNSTMHQTGLAMMFGLAASANWLGYLVLNASSMLDIIPAIIIFAVAELAFDFDKRLQLRSLMATGTQRLGNLSSENIVLAAEQEDRNTIAIPDDQVSQVDETPLESSSEIQLHEDDSSTVRNTIEQFDLNGRRSLSGYVNTEFANDQKKQELVVAFCPPFNNQPEIEFEPDDERVEAKLVNCTPIGARFLLRKTEAEDSFSCRLEWYATAADDDSENSLITSRILP